MRVEHWDNAINQGRHAARSMLGGDGYDELIMRGDIDDGAVSALRVRADTVVAGMHVNDWDAIEPLRAWIGHPATSALRDTTCSRRSGRDAPRRNRPGRLIPPGRPGPRHFAVTR